MQKIAVTKYGKNAWEETILEDKFKFIEIPERGILKLVLFGVYIFKYLMYFMCI